MPQSGETASSPGETVTSSDEAPPTEAPPPCQTELTTLRMDFIAKIITSDGISKFVSIELQKAKLPSDIMRFRQYLGGHYQNKENTYKKDGKTLARQIYCIYFLNHGIGYPDSPVLKINPGVTDAATGAKLEYSPDDEDEFVKSLNHLTWVVQIPGLKTRRRNDLENLLSIFDQGEGATTKHFLNIREEDTAEKWRPILRRLQQAAATESIRQNMEDEDWFFEPMKDNIRQVAEQAVVIGEQAATIATQAAALEKAEAEKAAALEKAEAAEKDKTLAIARSLKAKGLDTAFIAETTGLPLAEIENLDS